MSGTTFPSHSELGTVVGTLETLDPNIGDHFTYTLVEGSGSSNNGDFAIDGSSVVVGNAALFPGSYSIRIRSVDSGSMFVEETFQLEAVFGLCTHQRFHSAPLAFAPPPLLTNLALNMCV